MVILYVDPLEEVRSKRIALFRKENLTVFEASDAEAAVEIAQQLERLDVLVAEGVLGHYTGFDLRDAIREKFPALRAVFTSRYDLSDFQQQIGDNLVLFEPVSDSQLLSEVRGFCKVEVEPSPPPPQQQQQQEKPPPSAAAPPPRRATTPEPLAKSAVAPAAPASPASLAAKTTPPAPKASFPAAVPPPAPDGITEDADAQSPAILKPGAVLGSYVIQERFYHERTTETYRALQQGVGREVAVVLLKPEFANDRETLADFLERQRIKASVSHHHIAPLYESVQTGPYQFYTRELPHGRSLEQWQASGRKFNEKVLADLVAGVADAMSYATLRGYHYRMLTARDVFIDSENNPSIVNVFRPATSTPRDYRADTKRFINLLRPVAEGPRARHLLDDLANDLADWEDLRQRARDFQEDLRERSLLKRAGTQEVHDIQASQSATIPLWAYVLTALVVLGLIIGIYIRESEARPELPAPVAELMTEVPAGPFIFQKNETRNLPAFWIDTYEVTIGQYAAFLAAVAEDPLGARQYDHPEQPPGKTSHQPVNWEPAYTAAVTGALLNNQRIDINTPVSGVDWWDAYAYAKWKGHRLPTEEEWEKAARGSDRRVYPWGNQAEAKNANLGLDYEVKGTGGNIDGFNFWAPVNKMDADKSPYGVIGMAGNVDEWTATWANHPDFPDFRVPIVRGGHFALRTLGTLVTNRTFPDTPEASGPTRGFRTVSDNPPRPTAAP